MAKENNKFIKMVGGENGTDKKTQKMLTTALVSNILGRNEDAVKEAVKKKEEQIFGNPGPFFNTQGSSTVSPLKTKDSVTDILGKMYNFREITHDKELLASEIRHNMEMAQKRDQEKEQNKILQMFTNKVSARKSSNVTATRSQTTPGKNPAPKDKNNFLKKAWNTIAKIIPDIAGTTFFYNAEKYKQEKLQEELQEKSTDVASKETAEKYRPETVESNDWQGMVYNAFIGAGFSEKQALALTAEVGRENDYNPTYMFGQHIDAASKNQNRKITNIGILSFNDSRRNELIEYMRKKGLVSNQSGGNVEFSRSQESLDAQAQFIKSEIESKSEYSKTKQQFLSNPNIGKEDAAQVLGKNYIRWDYGGNSVLGKKIAKRHNDKRRLYYEQMQERIEKLKKSKTDSKLESNTQTELIKPNNQSEQKTSTSTPVNKQPTKIESNRVNNPSETKSTTPVSSVKSSANIEITPSVRDSAIQVGSKENEQMKDDGAVVVVNQVAMLNNTTLMSGGKDTTMIIPQPKSDRATLLEMQYG